MQQWLALQHSCPIPAEQTFSLVPDLLSYYLSAVRKLSDPFMYGVFGFEFAPLAGP